MDEGKLHEVPSNVRCTRNASIEKDYFWKFFKFFNELFFFIYKRFILIFDFRNNIYDPTESAAEQNSLCIHNLLKSDTFRSWSDNYRDKRNEAWPWKCVLNSNNGYTPLSVKKYLLLLCIYESVIVTKILTTIFFRTKKIVYMTFILFDRKKHF